MTAKVDSEGRSQGTPFTPAPYSVWRRIVQAEAADITLDLDEAEHLGSPYPDDDGYSFGSYLKAARAEVELAMQSAACVWSTNRLRQTVPELVRVWTGSEHETAAAALHRARGLYLMIASKPRLRAEALKIEAMFKSTTDIPMTDPRHGAYSLLFARIQQASSSSGSETSIDIDDRLMLREVRREQNESWEIARARVRIFRNILTATIPALAIVLIIFALIAWMHPSLLPLGSADAKSDRTTVALVELLGAFGGMLSGVATIRAARNFRRFYGLPLAQIILKFPAGAASALAGVLLVQHGALGSIGPFTGETVLAYALLFGVAQIAVTKQIDVRAGDLLGEANAKSPSSGQSSPAGRGGGDA